MADAVSVQVYDGARNCQFKITDVSDGTGLSGYNLTNVSSLTPNPGVHMKVRRIRYSVTGPTGFSVRMQWAATTPVDLVIIGQGEDILDFSEDYAGGIPNNGGDGATGDIILTTIAAAANANFTLYIECIKGV